MSGRLATGSLPLYLQLKERIRERIRAGEWAPDSLIPSERELCATYGVSRMTARQALTELVNEGVLYRRQGLGTFVGRLRIDQELHHLSGFSEDMSRRHQSPGARVLTAEMWNADQRAARDLRIRHDQPVFRLSRLRLANGEPMALETTIIWFLGCERLLEEDFSQTSLYQTLERKYDITLLEAEQEISAGLAGERESQLLEIDPGSPVLRFRRLTLTRGKQPVERAISVYRGDRYSLHTRLVRDNDKGGL